MSYAYIESQRISLRAAGYDESWLQRTILANPGILGLGDLKPAGREVRQSPGGKLDFLFFDPDAERMYEVEVMLGATDESHIIRTLEYWDVESRRWPNREHRAVIVAEEITNRFFNVIWLLNRSIPIIAIKLDTLVVDGKATINFSKILDIYEVPEGRDPIQSGTSTRQAWEAYANADSLRVFDESLKLLSANSGAPRVTYSDNYIAIGGTKKNFAWFYPNKRDKHCMVVIRVGEVNAETILPKLQGAGVAASRDANGLIKVKLLAADLQNCPSIAEALQLGVEEGGGL
jgi:hypothetical protein